MRLHVQAPSKIEQRNPNYKTDIAYVTKHSKWILKSLGIWPATPKGAAKFLPKLKIGFGNSVLLFAIIPCVLYMTLEVKDVILKLKLLGLLSFCTAALIKYWALALQKSVIQICIDELRTDWKQVESINDRQTMLKYGQVGRKLTILCAVFMYTAGAIYHTIMQYAFGTYVDAYNRTIKPLVYPSYSALYDVQSFPTYEIVYMVHLMCGYVLYSVTAGACGLAALFSTHVCGQIDIVQSRLNDLVQSDNRNTLNMRLVNIVEHHLRILKFSAMVELVLQEVCFVEFVSSTFMICLLEYYCITDWEQKNPISLTSYILLLVSLTFNIFILCYIGELLMEKTHSIGLSCFMIDWFYLPTDTIKGLILIMAISNNPAKLSAGKIVDLSLNTFGNVLKTSLAYLSFLRTALL